MRNDDVNESGDSRWGDEGESFYVAARGPMVDRPWTPPMRIAVHRRAGVGTEKRCPPLSLSTIFVHRQYIRIYIYMTTHFSHICVKSPFKSS